MQQDFLELHFKVKSQQQMEGLIGQNTIHSILNQVLQPLSYMIISKKIEFKYVIKDFPPCARLSSDWSFANNIYYM